MFWWDKTLHGIKTPKGDKRAFEYSDGGSRAEIATCYHTGEVKSFKTQEERDSFVKKNSYKAIKKKTNK